MVAGIFLEGLLDKSGDITATDSIRPLTDDSQATDTLGPSNPSSHSEGVIDLTIPGDLEENPEVDKERDAIILVHGWNSQGSVPPVWVVSYAASIFVQDKKRYLYQT